ncbi:hypothetical protein BH10CHL1_BH10CHL1_13840 [soil metagenome]
MVKIEEIAEAALHGESLLVRSMTQDFLRHNPRFVDISRPVTTNESVLALSAAFLELFAARSNQPAPSWTAKIGPVAQPIFLLKAAKQMKRLRELCEAESPEPLRQRRLYATPDYLEFA